MLAQTAIAGTSLRPSAIALGTADWTWRQGDDLDKLYTTFREAGGNCFDGAHCYAFWVDAEGAPERALGQIVRKHDKREDVILCTKGCHVAGGPKYPRPDRYMTAQTLASDVNDSLERMATDYIDLYYLHRDDPRVPVDEILDALHEQQKAGRLRYYAASNWWPNRLDEAATYAKKKGYQGFVASQILFNLGELAHKLAPDMCALDDAQIAWYQKTKVPLFAFSSTANGFFAKTGPAQGSYATPTSEARRQRCTELGQRKGASANQIALAYIMNQDFPVIPVTGTLRIEHLQDACRAAQIRLTPEEVSWLRDGK